MSNVLSRGDFFKGGKPPMRSVEVPDLGGVVHVRVMSAADKDRFDGEQTTAKGAQRFADFRARLVVACACDESGAPLFTREDIPAISDLPLTTVEPIVDAAIEINRLGAKDLEAARKNSDPTHDVASSGEPR